MNWKNLFCAAILASGSAFAGEWELGLMGGFSYSPDLGVTGNGSSGVSAGIGHGGEVGVYGGDDTYRYFGGEVRYLYGFGDLQASSGNTTVNFSRSTHIITGNILGYFRPTESKVRPFISFGGGAEEVNGTGMESAAQPLGNFVALTHTRQLLGVGDIGVGIKIGLSKRLRFRVEAHDYLGSSPSQVLAPAPGASIGGFMNNIIATASLAVNCRL